MPNINLIGTEPDQIPTNADLGTLAFQDQDYVDVGNLIVATVDVTTEARFARFSTANARITGGSLTGGTGAFSTLTATNFSSGNAEITGTGSHIGTDTAGAVSRIANVYSSLGNYTNFSTANAQITGGSITTLVATNFSSGNAEITGTGSHIGTDTAGAVSRIANVYSSLGNYTNFSTANAQITGGSLTGVTGAASTLVATNFSSGNAQITGGSLTGGTGAFTTLATTNFSTANGYISGTSSSIGTAVSGALDRVANVYGVLGNFTNFSAANAVITGGSATHLVATNFSSANAEITGSASHIGTDTAGAVSRVANVYSSLGNFTDFSSGNARITGGSLTGGTGAFSTLTATNFSSGNISITGGNIILAPGTTGTAPLTFSTGGVLTLITAMGQIEYTTLFHGTTQGTERGLIPTPQIFVLNADRGLATVTTTQTLFNQTFKVTAGTRYYYEAFISISKQNATANTLQYAIVVATAVIASHEYSVISKVAAARTTLTAPVQMSNRITSGFDALVAISSPSAAAAATFDAHIQGYFDITTGGTINPQIALATNATTTPLLLAQSYWLMYPVGVTAANTSIQ